MALLTFNSAMKLLTQKRYQEVYNLAVSALKEDEKNPLAFFFLGLVAGDNGQAAKALEFHAKASELAPLNVHYHAAHAKALMALGRQEEAKARADIAAKVGTKDAFVSDMIGTVYSRSGRHDMALPLFKQAVKINPKWPIFQFNLGVSAQFTGDLKTAKAAYTKAVALDPKFYQAWFSLVSLGTQTPEDNHQPALETLFAQASQDAEGQLLLGHAIAKTLEDMGQFAESLTWLERAKAARKNQIPYPVQDMKQMFAAAKTAAPKPQSARKTGGGVTPIFIAGLPRTGTTLVDRIISSHANAHSAGELDLFAKILEGRTQTHRAQSAQFFRSAQDSDLAQIGSLYEQQIQNLAGSKTHLIDKTPMNFFYAGLISQALPDARIIVLRRGAMDSCLSNYRQMFAPGDRRFDYALDLENTAAYYREFDALMTHWRGALQDGRFLEVRYEDIVHGQEAQTRRLLDFCGLDWDPACLDFHENKAPVDTASSVQVRQPLYSKSIDRWKQYGENLRGLKTALGDLAEP
ncbi:MAG: tetratricopeptide repeat-containing sulfotransferase family protein [Alphaproteobacteria bacterium]